MGKDSGIEWTDHTFNPWVGCTKISPACDACYAEAWAKRTGQPALWEGERRRTSAAYWRQPLRWNAEAAAAGRRARVFCASLADVFDNKAEPAWRTDLWALIDGTPHLDWLLLTKRPTNIPRMLPHLLDGVPPWEVGWHNVWLGTTVENQAEADRRVPALLDVPARRHFLSCEPLLGPLLVQHWMRGDCAAPRCNCPPAAADCPHSYAPGTPAIDWVIAGGESGPRARPTHPDWLRGLRDQCRNGAVPFFLKQWGEWGWTPGRGDIVMHADGTVLDGDTRAYQIDPLRRDDRKWRGMTRLGKKASGALLDDREHREVPA